MTCRSGVSHPSGKSASCPCFPSCQLFPRRSDGKVVLPNPAAVNKHKEDTASRIVPSTSQEISLAKPKAIPAAQKAPRPYYQGTEGIQGKPADPGGKLEWRPSKDPSPASTKPVDNYAQLSLLPEFKAFRLNKDGYPEERKTASPGPSVSNGTPEPQEWMRELTVSRRTKRQSYVRSGTHDFCIRLYTGQNED